MTDLILAGTQDGVQNCGFEASDFTFDGQVNVIDVTECSNWTEPYGVEVDDDEMVILSQSEYSEAI